MSRPTKITARDNAAKLDALAKKEPRGRVRDRIRLIASILRGKSVGDAAKAAGLSERAGWLWLARYNSGGAASLADRPRSGQPRKLGEKRLLDKLRSALGGAKGVAAARGQDVRDAARKKLGIAMSLSTAYNTLHRIDGTAVPPVPAPPQKKKRASSKKRASGRKSR